MTRPAKAPVTGVRGASTGAEFGRTQTAEDAGIVGNHHRLGKTNGWAVGEIPALAAGPWMR